MTIHQRTLKINITAVKSKTITINRPISLDYKRSRLQGKYLKKNMASKSFVSIEDFSTAVHRKGKEPKTKGWTEIPIHTIFRILSITKKVSVYGPCFLVKAESAAFDTISFFGSKSFVADFEKGRKPNHSCYFISLGQEVHQHTHHLKNRYFLLFYF